MAHPALSLLDQRVSAARFDPSHRLAEADVTELVRLATRAPTAYHLQNWRFIAVRSEAAKAALQALAFGQPQVAAAAVTFIVCGTLPEADDLPQRLAPCVNAGFMPAHTVRQWHEAAARQYADPQAARDEAVRSATLGAATLMHAAQAMGWASGPMGGFDPAGVARHFALGASEVPVLLVAVGAAAPGNWPQKPRRPLADVMAVA